ncbi:uncharacterized protein LOC135494650 [Lineus longissimus]|uniref:uncharacterized protein LOC135494650 n=1 Tax=Lineus longissimus TaxID=88925 RepID=UPI00315CE94F
MGAEDNSKDTEMAGSTDYLAPSIQSDNRSRDEGDPLDSVDIVSHKSLTVPGAVVFIIGGMAGSGILALPKAVDNLGWVGIVMVGICSFLAAYTGSILGKCWLMLRELYPEYRVGRTGYPYPAVGFRSYNKVGRYAVSLCIDFTQFGVGVVFVLLAAEIIQELLADVGVHVSFCYWMIIIVAVLTPPTWLESPKDMWHIAIAALASTAIACICIVAKIIMARDLVEVYHNPVEIKPALMSLGTIFFAYGNHPVLLSIQHDMKEQDKFSKSVYIAYTLVLCMYLPVAMAGYVVLGSGVDDNVIASLYKVANGPLLYVAQILLTLHLLFEFVIVINPVLQEIEGALKVPQRIGIKRIVIRTLFTCAILFVAETIPKFGNLLSLVGGTTTALLSFFFPVFFYNKLCDSINRQIPLHQRVFHYEIMIVAVLIGIAATYAAVEGIVNPNSFVSPCYVDISAAGGGN